MQFITADAPKQARTLGEDLRAWAATTPSAEAIVAGGVRATYAEFDAAADGFAAALRAAGVSRGDRVLIMLPNRYEAAVAVYGVLRAGAAISPLNPTIKPDKLRYVVADSGAAVIVADESTWEVAETGGIPVVSVTSEPGLPTAPPTDVDLAGVIYTSGSTG